MFWEWFWELYNINFPKRVPCSACKLHPSEDCGYLESSYDYWNGVMEYECTHEDWEELECPCLHLLCKECKK